MSLETHPTHHLLPYTSPDHHDLLPPRWTLAALRLQGEVINVWRGRDFYGAEALDRVLDDSELDVAKGHKLI